MKVLERMISHTYGWNAILAIAVAGALAVYGLIFEPPSAYAVTIVGGEGGAAASTPGEEGQVDGANTPAVAGHGGAGNAAPTVTEGTTGLTPGDLTTIIVDPITGNLIVTGGLGGAGFPAPGTAGAGGGTGASI
jgi:hypothetical protein